jgi:hypothetical protein
MLNGADIIMSDNGYVIPDLLEAARSTMLDELNLEYGAGHLSKSRKMYAERLISRAKTNLILTQQFPNVFLQKNCGGKIIYVGHMLANVKPKI